MLNKTWRCRIQEFLTYWSSS